MAARATTAAPVPAREERQPRARPAARTIVSASTISTALARNAERMRKTALMTPRGTLTSIATPDSTLSYTYFGSLLNTTTWAGTVAGSVSRNYDTNFRIITQSVNGVDTIAFPAPSAYASVPLVIWLASR